MSKQAVMEAARRLAAQHNLEPGFSMVIVKAGPEDVIIVAAICGRECEMPPIPSTFEGFPIERIVTGAPVARPATRRTPPPVKRKGDAAKPWSFTSP